MDKLINNFQFAENNIRKNIHDEEEKGFWSFIKDYSNTELTQKEWEELWANLRKAYILGNHDDDPLDIISLLGDNFYD